MDDCGGSAAATYFLSLRYTAPHWPRSAFSAKGTAQQREVEPTELTEGRNTGIYGDMMDVASLHPTEISR